MDKIAQGNKIIYESEFAAYEDSPEDKKKRKEAFYLNVLKYHFNFAWSMPVWVAIQTKFPGIYKMEITTDKIVISSNIDSEFVVTSNIADSENEVAVANALWRALIYLINYLNDGK